MRKYITSCFFFIHWDIGDFVTKMNSYGSRHPFYNKETFLQDFLVILKRKLTTRKSWRNVFNNTVVNELICV